VIFFQQLHYYDIPGLFHALSSGNWLDAQANVVRVESVSDAWYAPMLNFMEDAGRVTSKLPPLQVN
jgi:hypothetical protein